MSGIVAIWRRSGAPLDPAVAETSLQRLHHRGPHGAFLLVDHDVALGLQLFKTTPASEFENGPVKSAHGGAIAVSDARLDNRFELMRELRDELHGRDGVSDTELILAAYERWCDDCPQHMLGDFAFAVWDASRRRLFCARDHMGVRQLYLMHGPDLCAVATQLPALVPLLPTRRLDMDMALQFLVNEYPRPEHTWFAGIERVLPAHSVSIATAAITDANYWRLDGSIELDVGVDEAVDGFRRIFTVAVKDRLAHVGKAPGVFLSGGLDSSSVTCVARDLLAADRTRPLETVSSAYDDLPLEEPYRDAVFAAGGVKGRSIDLPRDWKPLSGLANLISGDDEPAWTPFLAIWSDLNAAAKAAGCDIMLNGEGGDATAGDGYWYLADLARRLAVVPLLQSSYQVSRQSQTTWSNAFWVEGLRSALPDVAKAAARRVLGGARKSGIDPAAYLSPQALRRVQAARTPQLDNELKARPSRRRHALLMSDPYIGLGHGIGDRLAASSQVEPRMPFADRRLLEYSLSLPASHKLHGGWPRALLRNAMAGVVPDLVRYRTDKSGPNHSFVEAMTGNDRKALQELSKSAESLAALVDLTGLGRLSTALLERPDVVLAEQLWRINLLATWVDLSRVGLGV